MGGTRRKAIEFVIKPLLILTKHKQRRCFWKWVFKSIGLENGHVIFKIAQFVFITLVLKKKDDWILFSVLPTRLFRIAWPLIEIQNYVC